MSFAYLNMPESLRPWHTAGLQFLFPAASASASKNPSARSAPAAAPEEAPQAHAEREPAAPPSGAPAAAAKTPALSPEALAQLYAKVSIPCFSVWTYWDLGQDLLATPSPQRRSLLGALIQGLAWPRGSISFWPMAVPAGHGTQTCLSEFWQAIRRINPRVIAVFGKAAFEALAPGTPYELFHCEGTAPVLVALPDIPDISPKSALYDRTCALLRELRETTH